MPHQLLLHFHAILSCKRLASVIEHRYFYFLLSYFLCKHPQSSFCPHFPTALQWLLSRSPVHPISLWPMVTLVFLVPLISWKQLTQMTTSSFSKQVSSWLQWDQPSLLVSMRASLLVSVRLPLTCNETILLWCQWDHSLLVTMTLPWFSSYPSGCSFQIPLLDLFLLDLKILEDSRFNIGLIFFSSYIISL